MSFIVSSSPKKIVVLPDSHSHPDFHNKRYEWFAKFLLDEKPDYVVDIGDFWDMPSLCSYDKGTRSFEGRRYKADIEAGLDAQQRIYDITRAPKKKLPHFFRTIGNHECVSLDTEILTDNGWVYSQHITENDLVANVGVKNEIYFAKPLAVSLTKDTGYNVIGDMHDEFVSSKHNLIINDRRVPVNSIDEKVNQTSFTYSVNSPSSLELSEDEIRLLVWAVSDSTYVVGPGNKRRVQWKLSKERKIVRLESLLAKLGLKYTIREAIKSGLNKLQPYYICCYGDEARTIMKLTGEVKRYPDDLWKRLNKNTVNILAEEISHTDGNTHFNHVQTSSVVISDLEKLQLAFVLNGIPAKITRNNRKSGFPNAKEQFGLSIFNNGIFNRSYVDVIEDKETNIFVAIQTPSQRLITRRNGKVVVTGNCRIEKVTQLDPVLHGTIGLSDLQSKEYGWEEIPFGVPLELEGIIFKHYFTSGVMGRPIGGENHAKSLITKQFKSCVQGHSHLFDYARRTDASGKKIHGLVVGVYQDFDSDYAGPSNKLWDRGIAVLENVCDGDFDVRWISLERLKKAYAT